MAEYKAKKEGNVIKIRPIIEKKKNKSGGYDVKVRVPSLNALQRAQGQ